MQTMSQMYAKSQRLQMERGLGLLVVDYLQLIKPSGAAPTWCSRPAKSPGR